MHGPPKCAFSPRLRPASRLRHFAPIPQVADSGYFVRNDHAILYLQIPLVAKSLINQVFSARSHKGTLLLTIANLPNRFNSTKSVPYPGSNRSPFADISWNQTRGEGGLTTLPLSRNRRCAWPKTSWSFAPELALKPWTLSTPDYILASS